MSNLGRFAVAAVVLLIVGLLWSTIECSVAPYFFVFVPRLVHPEPGESAPTMMWPQVLTVGLFYFLAIMTTTSLILSHIRGAGRAPRGEEWLILVEEELNRLFRTNQGRRHVHQSEVTQENMPLNGDDLVTSSVGIAIPSRNELALQAKRLAAQGDDPVARIVPTALSANRREHDDSEVDDVTNGLRIKSDAVDIESTCSPSDLRFVRWCDRGCGAVPLRSRHCRDCGACSLKLEHHCLWIGACVGHDNHKSFVLFLMYASAGLVLSLAFTVLSLHQARSASPPPEGLSGTEVVDEREEICEKVRVANFLVTVPVAAFVLYVMRFQIGVVASNTMSVERSNRRWKEKDGLPWPYDLGLLRNWQELLGAQWWIWPWPVAPHTNGLFWEGNTRYATRC